MGNTNNSEQGLDQGQGFRIVQVSENGPFTGKVEVFFDFIVGIIPPQPEVLPSEILNKLSNQPEVKVKKSPMEILHQNIGKVIQVKIVSTKYRSPRTIEVNLSNQIEQNGDKIGIAVRKERFDEVFDTYFPVADIQNNSPAKKAGIREGHYLIGCVEYPYKTNDAFMEGLYQRFFDKEIKDKTVNLVLYDIATDSLHIKEVVLRRGWGGKGLLGCDFLQGLLNRFPRNFEGQRKYVMQQDHKKKEVQKLRNQLGDCDGASKSLIETLYAQKSKKAKHFRNIRNLLNIHPPDLSVLNKVQEEQKNQELLPNSEQKLVSNPQQGRRMEDLQRRVSVLQKTLNSVKDQMNKMQLPEQEEIKIDG